MTPASGAASRQVLALIPARGGSKSIQKKNLVVVGGKPLIAHSIEQAHASRLITRTIVSTDDTEIADVARQWGAEVPFLRPTELAQDDSLDLDVFRHALAWLAEREQYRCELVVHLRPTGPVRRVALIDQAIDQMFADSTAHSLRSVTWPLQTPYKMWRRDGRYLRPLLGVEGIREAHSAPRQSLPEVFWQNGYVDIVRPAVVLEQASMVGDRVLPFVVDEPVLELDYPESLPVIERALRALASGQPPEGRSTPGRHPI